MKKVFPARLHHGVPGWVSTAALFHIRIRCARENEVPLIAGETSAAILESVRFYAVKLRWWPRLFLLMPDHIHALVTFPQQEGMSRVIGDWKKWNARTANVKWQENFFDHRLRSPESGAEKWEYIRMNPVRAGLCAKPEDWPHAIYEDAL